MTSVPVAMDEGGHGPLGTGLVVTGYFVGFGLGSLRADRLVVRVGHVRAFAGFAAALAASAIAHTLVPSSLAAWLALRLVAGFSIAGLYLVNESWMNAVGDGSRRGLELALYMGTVHLAIAAGQLLFGALGEDVGADFARHFALAALLVCAGAVPVSLYTVRAPAIEPSPSLSLRTLGREAPLGLVAAVASGALGGAIYGMGPLFAKTTAVPVGGVSTFMTSVVLGGLLFQLPVGRWSDRTDRRRVLAGVAFGTGAVALLLLAARPESPALAILLAGLFGGLALTIYPLGLAHVFDRVERGEALPAVGAVLACYAAGSSLGPLLASASMQRLGSAGFAWFIAAVALLLGAAALLRIRGVAPVPVEAQEPFAPAARTSAAAAELDPRTPDGAEEPLEDVDVER